MRISTTWTWRRLTTAHTQPAFLIIKRKEYDKGERMLMRDVQGHSPETHGYLRLLTYFMSRANK